MSCIILNPTCTVMKAASPFNRHNLYLYNEVPLLKHFQNVCHPS